MIRRHLKSDTGDGYVIFCMLVLCGVLFFGAIFGTIKTRVEAVTLYNQIENSVDIVISNTKKECYKTLKNGLTTDLSATLTPTILINHIATMLNYDDTIDQIDRNTNFSLIKNGDNGKLKYIVKVENCNVSSVSEDTANIFIKVKIEMPIYLNGHELGTGRRYNQTFEKNTTLKFKEY